MINEDILFSNYTGHFKNSFASAFKISFCFYSTIKTQWATRGLTLRYKFSAQFCGTFWTIFWCFTRWPTFKDIEVPSTVDFVFAVTILERIANFIINFDGLFWNLYILLNLIALYSSATQIMLRWIPPHPEITKF